MGTRRKRRSEETLRRETTWSAALTWYGRERGLAALHQTGELVAKAQAVVLAAVLRVDVRHVGQVRAWPGRLVRRQVLQVVVRDDGLGVGRLPDPALLHPGAVEGR